VTATRRELVLAAVARCFSDAERNRALEILDTYGLEPHEGETERVQLAVLNLCGGDLGRLKHFVEAAKTDYRDVLFWSE
jgi:hypothetical protein